MPLGLAQLVEAIEPTDRVAWLDRTGTSSALLADGDPLFPLPANEEQRDIIDRLAADSGVVVEGPPGTGKTHSIANLVSALLARGQRVLVTSEKAQALRVLRDKLPPELQDLCVSVTDAARGGSAELNHSVSEIATRKAQFNQRRTAQRIRDLATQRTDATRRRATLTEQIRKARAEETVVHPEVVAGYQGTLASIVRQVRAQETRYGWLPAPLLTDAPPLNTEELHTLLSLHQRSSAERARRRHQVFPELSLPGQDDVQYACNAVAQAPREVTGSEMPGLLRILEGASPAALDHIRGLCEHLQGALQDAEQLDPRFQRVADDVLSGKAQHLWGKTAEFAGLVQAAQDADRFIGAATCTRRWWGGTRSRRTTRSPTSWTRGIRGAVASPGSGEATNNMRSRRSANPRPSTVSRQPPPTPCVSSPSTSVPSTQSGWWASFSTISASTSHPTSRAAVPSEL